MKLTFLGAAGEVTGSCFMIETGRIRFLVDCGMFQGGHDAERRNWRALAFDPKSIEFVLLTHAHIDHSGLIPRLSALGYRGPVFCTRATADLASVMLRDSAHVQEQESQWRNRLLHRMGRASSFGTPPLYTVTQAERSLRLLHGVDYDREITPHPSVRASFRDAGHILGSAIIEVAVTDGDELAGPSPGIRLVFSGDLGLPTRPVVRDPTPIEHADVLLVESTYGDRLHRTFDSTRDELSAVVSDTLLRRKGNVIFPAFAVGRTQSILCVLAELVQAGRVPPLQIYVDSPLAEAATEVTLRHRDVLDPETQALLRWMQGEPREFRVRFTGDSDESRALNAIESGAVILSASGMCDAGRIKHHLRFNLPRSGSAVVITGFQARGTLGRKLVDRMGSVRIFDENVPVRASIHTIGGLSAHADQKGLLDWLGHFRAPPRRTFVVHGERSVASGFAELVRSRLRWPEVRAPEAEETATL